MNEELTQPSFLNMLTDMYERAHISAALLDSELRLVWCSTEALNCWPLLATAGNTTPLLAGRSIEQVCDEITHCGFYRTPGSEDNLFAEQPAIIYAAPIECGAYYMLHPAPHMKESSGLHPSGLARSVSAFESHYRTPIASIFSTLMVFGKSIQEDRLSPELIPYVESLQQNTFKLLRSTQLVSEYTRMSNGLLSLRPTQIEIFGLLNELLCAVASLTATIDLPLSFTLPNGILNILCDADLLLSILLNLISNSCRFTRPDNQINVNIRVAKDRIYISVVDHGIGIPPDILPHVREPYYSYSKDGTPFAGTGLGLAIASKSAVLLGGTLTISSIQNEGTTAVFSLPINTAISGATKLHVEPHAYLDDRFSPVYIALSDSISFPL